MSEPILVARGERDLVLLPRMANRHGLIAGATGTGKTVSMQVLAENFSRLGVPVFLADVKGDVAGISQPNPGNPRVAERLEQLKISAYTPQGCPVAFWDIFGEAGHPARTTISEMGPLLLGRLLELNEVQTGVLSLVFRIADDDGLLLIDLKDLRSMLRYCGDNAARFRTAYGNISPATIGTVQRSLLGLEEQGAGAIFGEPALDLSDLLQTDQNGRGVVNILAANRLMQTPRVYAPFLLWMLSELFERLPEVGDPEKPRLVFFFDEAHLLFNDISRALEEKIEQVVRLIRSKGVGIYFVTQNPLDVPETILGQLGNRIQHALRAFTPRDQKAVRAAATTFRSNPGLNVEAAITELEVGEALVSLLDDKGVPGMVERAFICPPASQIGPIADDRRREIVQNSPLGPRYQKSVDRESAFERLQQRLNGVLPGASGAGQPVRTRGRGGDSLLESVAKSTLRSMGSQLGRSIVRGVLGSIFGGRR